MIECLESRIAPAGLVAVSLKGGVLSFTGDAEDNAIQITPLGGGDYDIRGLNGTLLDRGIGVGPEIAFFLSGILAGLKVDLGAGSDSFDSTGLKVAGATSILGGEGTDGVVLSNHTNLGAITVDGGAGNDTVTFGGDYTLVRSKLTYTDTIGDNNFQVSSKSATFSSFQYTGGTGEDMLSFTSPILRTGAITVDFSTGVGNFLIEGKSATIGGALNVKLGAATSGTCEVKSDIFTITGAMNVGLGIGGNFLQIAPLLYGRIGGALKVTTEAGEDAGTDLIMVSGAEVSIGGGVNVQLGEGSNSFTLGGTVFRSGGDFVYTGGGGGDFVGLAPDNLTVSKKLVLNMGGGGNTADLAGSNNVLTGGMQYTGGDGEETLNLGGNWRAGAMNLQLGAGNAEVTLLAGRADIASLMVNAPSAPSDTLFLTLGVTDLHIKTIAKIMVGEGDSTVSFGVPDASVVIGGELSYLAGAGDNQLEVKGAEVRILKAKAELGAASGALGGSGVGIMADQLALGGLRYRGGAGQDGILIQAGDGVVGLVDVNVGEGLASLTVRSNNDHLRVAGINFNSAGLASEQVTLTIARAQVMGAVNVNLGAGDDSVAFSESIFAGAVLMQTDGGHDDVLVDTTDVSIGSRFRGVFSVVLGEGEDSLIVGNNTFGGHADFFNTVLIDAGADTDTTDLVTGNGNLFVKPPVVKNSETSS